MSIQRPTRLLLFACLMALAASTAYSNIRWLGAQAYSRFADEQGRWPEGRESARQAADIATRLVPLSARARQQLATDDLFLGQGEQALREYETALQSAPADAYLWRDYALALVYTNHYDVRLERAVAQAQSWGARSSTIHMSLAVAGLKVFNQSDASLRALWMNSIRYAYWSQPDTVLYTAYLAEQELLLCDEVILQAQHNSWCDAARWRHGLCSREQRAAGSCGSGP